MIKQNKNPNIFVSFSYQDEWGNRYSSVSPLRATRTKYDAEGNVLGVTYIYDTPTKGRRQNLKEEVFNYLEELEVFAASNLLQESSRRRKRAQELAEALRDYSGTSAA